MKPLTRTLVFALSGIACGYIWGTLWFPKSYTTRIASSSIPAKKSQATKNDGARNLETSWQAALSAASLDEVDLVQCGRVFLLLPEADRDAALRQHEVQAGKVFDWFTMLHKGAIVIASMPPPEKPVGTRAEFNELLAKSPDQAAKQLRQWMLGSWSEKAYAFALLANSAKSPGLAHLCVDNQDLLMAAIDPELPLRSVCNNRELSFDEARQFVAGIKGDLYRRYAEATLNIRAYKENLIPAEEYIAFDPNTNVRLARLRLWTKDVKIPSQASMTQILKLFEGSPNEQEAAKILTDLGYSR